MDSPYKIGGGGPWCIGELVDKDIAAGFYYMSIGR
jgi:hypothetical protein